MNDHTYNLLRSALVYEICPRTHSPSRNLAGIIPDLPRIAALGADFLYVMPIYPIGVDGRKGVLGSPYSIQDFRAVNPDYGTEADFKAVLEAAHAQGMKVMLDIVYNHTSRDSVLSREHPEWFRRDANGNFFNNVPEWTDIIDLDFGQRGLWDYLIETLIHWVKLGVDAFRCDVAPLIPMEFWRLARQRVDAVRPTIWLAESGWMCFVKQDRDLGIVHHSDPELHGAFDMTYDADGGEYILKYFRGEAEIKDYLHQVYLQETLYPPQSVKMRFLECHDDPRIASRIRDRDSLKCWTAFSMLLPGAVMLFAGQEVACAATNGEPAETGPQVPQPVINWSQGDSDFEQFVCNMVGHMKLIKKDCRVCYPTEITRGVVKIDWVGPTASYSAILNLENRFGQIPINFRLVGEDLLTGRPCDIADKLRIPSRPLVIRKAPGTDPGMASRFGWHV
jgi:glycosidase